jgi:hypothetical protein
MYGYHPLRHNGTNFEAMCDSLPEVNEHTVFALIRGKLPPQFQAQMDALRVPVTQMIEQKLVEILRSKIERALAAQG